MRADRGVPRAMQFLRGKAERLLNGLVRPRRAGTVRADAQSCWCHYFCFFIFRAVRSRLMQSGDGRVWWEEGLA